MPAEIVADALEAVFDAGDGVGPLTTRIEPGEQVLVLGPSGSGKSTLLHAFTGAVPRSIPASVSGQVTVGGRVSAEAGPAKLADTIGMVFQDPETSVCLPSVVDEVAFPLENLARDPADMPEAIAAALALAGASALAGRRTDGLSGGELQRVSLAAALAPEPAVLLLDEPTSMLDARGMADVRRALAAAAATGRTVVLVEHRLDEFAGAAGIAGLPSRWIVLDRGGRVIADGPGLAVAVEHAARLLAEGCWLPLDVELAAHTGELDGLAGDAGQALVRGLAAGASAPGVSEPNAPGASASAPSASLTAPALTGPALTATALTATALTVAIPGTPSRKRHRLPLVLHNVNLTLHPGQVTALVGANGSGKTSLLRVLAGVEPPAAGELQGDRAGLVFQHPEHQFVANSVRDEVAFGATDISADEVEALLAQFDLADFADRNPHTLSGGQMRRLSIAAMLAQRRPVLLADEPGFGLDRHATVDVLRALRGAAADGRAVLFSTHDARSIVGYADRVLVVSEGTVVPEITPWELLQQPALREAASLTPSPLVEWLAHEVSDGAAARRAVVGLDALARDAAKARA